VVLACVALGAVACGRTGLDDAPVRHEAKRPSDASEDRPSLAPDAAVERAVDAPAEPPVVDAPMAAETSFVDAPADRPDAAPQPPSCRPGGDGLTNCGADRESCCKSLPVTGGTFDRWYFNDGTGPRAGAQPATVSTFLLDKYEVTVGRYRQFVVAWNGGAGWTPAPGSGKHAHLNGGRGLQAPFSGPGAGFELGWNALDTASIASPASHLAAMACGQAPTWTVSPGDNETRPINCVTWVEAYAFCIWDGGFLPTDAEWEYAAAGGDEQREYAWGTTPPGTMNQLAIYGDTRLHCYYPTGMLDACMGALSVAPVGTAVAGAGRWGQLDLAGNVNEWNLDASAGVPTPCTDCADLTNTTRIFRGGAYGLDASYFAPRVRSELGATVPAQGIGFRCARSP
jgi:formylglycine-generating enzyme required for sulfatase activity